MLAEIESWPIDVLADYARIVELLVKHGPNLKLPYSRAFGDGLFELRPRGRSGIGRTFYCFLVGKRVVVLHAGAIQTDVAWNKPKEVPNKSNAPSPLMGEGWGEGDKSMPYPSPQPSPTRGEGVNQGIPKPDEPEPSSRSAALGAKRCYKSRRGRRSHRVILRAEFFIAQHDRISHQFESHPLHAFIKKSQQTPDHEIKLARKRLKEIQND